MLSPVVATAGSLGHLFEGTVQGSFCFVPKECISTSLDQIVISEIAYVHSGWDVKNMRFSEVLSGQHLFPDPSRPVINFNTVPVQVFLDRIGAGRQA